MSAKKKQNDVVIDKKLQIESINHQIEVLQQKLKELQFEPNEYEFICEIDYAEGELEDEVIRLDDLMYEVKVCKENIADWKKQIAKYQKKLADFRKKNTVKVKKSLHKPK